MLLLPLSVIVYLATNALFLPVPLFAPVDVDFPTDPLVYSRAALAHAIFVSMAVVPLFAQMQRGRQGAGGVSARAIPAWVPLGLTACGLIFVGVFVARNVDVMPLAVAIYQAESYGAYIEARNAVGDAILSRSASGNGLATLAFGFVFPAAMALGPLAPGIPSSIRRLARLLAWVGMVLPAVVIGSRMMLVFAAIYPLALWGFGRLRPRAFLTRLQGAWKAVAVSAACVAIAVVTFQQVFRATILDSAWGLAARVLVAPGAVSGGYYLLFPDFFPYRGIAGIFMMPIPSDTVDFRAISLAATGLDSHANGSILATAYSGAGIPGIAAVSLVLVTAAFAADMLVLRLPRQAGSLLVFANLYGILAIASTAMRVAVVTHGYLVGPALTVAALLFLRGVLPAHTHRRITNERAS